MTNRLALLLLWTCTSGFGQDVTISGRWETVGQPVLERVPVKFYTAPHNISESVIPLPAWGGFRSMKS